MPTYSFALTMDFTMSKFQTFHIRVDSSEAAITEAYNVIVKIADMFRGTPIFRNVAGGGLMRADEMGIPCIIIDGFDRDFYQNEEVYQDLASVLYEAMNIYKSYTFVYTSIDYRVRKDMSLSSFEEALRVFDDLRKMYGFGNEFPIFAKDITGTGTSPYVFENGAICIEEWKSSIDPKEVTLFAEYITSLRNP